MVSIDPEKYIQLRLQNHEQIRKVRTIDDVLAVVSYKMKVTQNFSSDENPVLELLEQTVKAIFIRCRIAEKSDVTF